MADYDYIIAGAGAAGCVLAYRLSANPAVRVLLIEAGPPDSHPFIHMPKGLAKVMADPRHVWAYRSKPEACTAGASEVWVRGRVLGGSSSINGMMYVRGQPADFDAIAELTSDDWSWEHIGAAYAALETHELGAGETRGDKGPIHVTLPHLRDALSEAQIAAGYAMGWSAKEDMNAPTDEVAIGYAPRTIHRGRRQSAAKAFLEPARSRRNLAILTDTTVDRVVFEARRAVGVRVVQGGAAREIRCDHEVIIAGGAMSSPGILERSGVGDPARLAAVGAPLVHANPQVGENLIEHRGLIMQWKLSRDVSHNQQYAGWRLLWSTAKYYLGLDSLMSAAAYEIVGWFKSDPGLNRPDVQILVAPFSFDMANHRQSLEAFPGMHVTVYPLRPGSKGRIHIETLDPDAPAAFEPNYRATEADRRSMIGAVRGVREYVRREPLAGLIACETLPGTACETDDQILDAYDRLGTCGYHAVGSCRMGKDAESVVDPALRVRGVAGLRVMDTSIMPTIPSGNTNGPTMAMAWRAADIILRDWGR
ncbi:MAG TPA: GMC family oxidoreductase N-terminal domain-containing protein [Caulobacteraceae bacterium]|nr:GMC family oxidoreductase N-terminal domain-containing protein [Caulobacteraceae bacterium]